MTDRPQEWSEDELDALERDIRDAHRRLLGIAPRAADAIAHLRRECDEAREKLDEWQNYDDGVRAALGRATPTDKARDVPGSIEQLAVERNGLRALLEEARGVLECLHDDSLHHRDLTAELLRRIEQAIGARHEEVMTHAGVSGQPAVTGAAHPSNTPTEGARHEEPMSKSRAKRIEAQEGARHAASVTGDANAAATPFGAVAEQAQRRGEVTVSESPSASAPPSVSADRERAAAFLDPWPLQEDPSTYDLEAALAAEFAAVRAEGYRAGIKRAAQALDRWADTASTGTDTTLRALAIRIRALAAEVPHE